MCLEITALQTKQWGSAHTDNETETTYIFKLAMSLPDIDLVVLSALIQND